MARELSLEDFTKDVVFILETLYESSKSMVPGSLAGLATLSKTLVWQNVHVEITLSIMPQQHYVYIELSGPNAALREALEDIHLRLPWAKSTEKGDRDKQKVNFSYLWR